MAGNDTSQTYFPTGTRVTWLERTTITDPTYQTGGDSVYTTRYVGTVKGEEASCPNKTWVPVEIAPIGGSKESKIRCVDTARVEGFAEIPPGADVVSSSTKKVDTFSAVDWGMAANTTFMAPVWQPFSSAPTKFSLTTRTFLALSYPQNRYVSWIALAGGQNTHQFLDKNEKLSWWGPAFGGGVSFLRNMAAPISFGLIATLAPMINTHTAEPALQADLGAHMTILRFLGLNVGCQFLSGHMASCGGGAGLNIPFYTH